MFSYVFVQLFQNTPMKTSVMEFRKVLGCRLSPCVLYKKCFHQRQCLEIFGYEIIPTKKSAKDFYSTIVIRNGKTMSFSIFLFLMAMILVATFLRIALSIDVVSHFHVKNISSQCIVEVLENFETKSLCWNLSVAYT